MIDLPQQLDLSYLNASRLLVRNAETVYISMIGCGGNGSWLAPSVVRIARVFMNKFRKTVRITFIDPDIVEAKNVLRQNFCDAEIGKFKADALAFRYGLAWGTSITAITEPFNHEMRLSEGYSNQLVLYIGCVDNAAARIEIAKKVTDSPSYTKMNTWWLDLGNTKAYGQVLLGNAGVDGDPFSIPGYCTATPLPSVQHPDLLIPEEEENADPFAGLSCADLALVDAQGMAINYRVAAEATDYLNRFLLTGDLTKFATYFDLASGTARSLHITPENVGRYLELSKPPMAN